MFSWSLESKDFTIINKAINKASRIYFFTNLVISVICILILFSMLFNTLIMFFIGQKFRAILMTFIDIFVIYSIYYNKKIYKRKKSSKYITSITNSVDEYNLTLFSDKIDLNGNCYDEKDIYAVFLLKNYTLFTLVNKSSFIIKHSDYKNELYEWLKTHELYIYSWDSGLSAKELAKTTRIKQLHKIRPALALVLALLILFYITGIGSSKGTKDTIYSEPVESFTFDIEENIYNQFHKGYEYFNSTHNFEETNNIYYSYISQASNVLSKIQYINGEVITIQEFLIFDDNNSCYIKYYRPENSEYFSIEILKTDKIISIHPDENGYTVTSMSNQKLYTEKDMYHLITEFDYIRNEFPLFEYAEYYRGVIHLEFENERFFDKESITFRMGIDDITFITDSKDKEYKISVNNAPLDELDTFTSLLNSTCEETFVSTTTFNQLISELNKITTQ